VRPHFTVNLAVLCTLVLGALQVTVVADTFVAVVCSYRTVVNLTAGLQFTLFLAGHICTGHLTVLTDALVAPVIDHFQVVYPVCFVSASFRTLLGSGTLEFSLPTNAAVTTILFMQNESFLPLLVVIFIIALLAANSCCAEDAHKDYN